LNVIRHLIVVPVTVAVNVPEPRAPLGAGIDWLTVMNAVSFVVFDERNDALGDATALATATTANIATSANIALFTFGITSVDRWAHDAPTSNQPMIREPPANGFSALLKAVLYLRSLDSRRSLRTRPPVWHSGQ
jgi:hypothetical protein